MRENNIYDSVMFIGWFDYLFIKLQFFSSRLTCQSWITHLVDFTLLFEAFFFSEHFCTTLVSATTDWRRSRQETLASDKNPDERRRSIFKNDGGQISVFLWKNSLQHYITRWFRMQHWFVLVLWYINHCWLFNVKSGLYKYIKYIWFVNISQQN